MHQKFLVLCLIASFLSFAHANWKCHSLLKTTSKKKLAGDLVDDSTIMCPDVGDTLKVVILNKPDASKSYCCYDLRSSKFYCCDKEEKAENVTWLFMFAFFVMTCVFAGILFVLCCFCKCLVICTLQNCTSMIGFIVALIITALLSLVAVAIAVSCWLMAYRRRPKASGPLPHPPEFSNPLFTTPEPVAEPSPDYLS